VSSNVVLSYDGLPHKRAPPLEPFAHSSFDSLSVQVPPPLPFVLIGHAASLTPYKLHSSFDSLSVQVRVLRRAGRNDPQAGRVRWS